MKIYITRNGDQYGPYSIQDANAHIVSGSVTLDDLAWHEGLAGWIPLKTVPGIIQPTPATPPAPPALPTAPPPSAGRVVHPTTTSSPKAAASVEGAAGTAVKEPVYAGFWIRFAALLVDMLVLVIPLQLISMVLGAVLIQGAQTAESQAELSAYVLVDDFAQLIVCWLYFALLEASAWQSTIGKKALGLKVIDEKGGRMSFGQASGRYFAKLLSTFILMAGYIMVAFTARKQGLHDRLARVYVIKEPKKA
ncbi:MAG: RDD family protein [Verrucomicrobiota bacterium]